MRSTPQVIGTAHDAVKWAKSQVEVELSGVCDNPVFFPEKDMAIRLADRLSLKNALDYLPLGEDYGILEVNPPQSFINKTLKELQLPARYNCQVIGIKLFTKGKESPVFKIVPSAEDIIDQNSIMVIIGKYRDIEKIQNLD